MHVHVHPLNSDTSLLLSVFTSSSSRPSYTLVIDPWLFGDSPTYHRQFSNQFHSQPSNIDSLRDLSHAPDAVFISQDKSDHCHEATLKELDPGTIVYAVRGADDIVRGWKHFDNVQRLPLVSRSSAGKPVEIGLPDGAGTLKVAVVSDPSLMQRLTNLHLALVFQFIPSQPGASSKPITVVYSGHGIPASALHSLLPPKSTIDLLLHPLARITLPFWLGGDVSLGYMGVRDISAQYDVRNLVGVHDEEKVAKGFVSWWIKKREEGVSGVGKVWGMNKGGWSLGSGGDEVEMREMEAWKCCGRKGEEDNDSGVESGGGG